MIISHSLAIILAAGSGSRLRPLTDDKPKCLVDFLGEPIIMRMINCLSMVGVENVVVVCGYKSDVLRKRLGENYAGVNIKYIENNIYDITNNMYSLWLAREYLYNGCYLIEGDIVCNRDVIDLMRQKGKNCSFWAGRRYHGDMDGCVLTENGEEKRIVKLQFERNPMPGEKPHQYKSTGILIINSDYGKKLAQWLDEDVKNGNTNIYYDLVISKHLEEKPIHIIDIDDKKWFEIDNFEDLKLAKEIFNK